MKTFLYYLSTNEYSERETQMVDHQCQISIPKGTSFCQCSLAYDTTDVTDNDNLATALSAQILISIVLISTFRKMAIEPIVLAKRWGITPVKDQKNIQATTQRGIRSMLHPLLLGPFRRNDRNPCYHHLAHPVFSDILFASTVSRRGNTCAQVYVTHF